MNKRLILYFSILLHCIVQWVLQVMFPSACSFIVCWFSPSFTKCFSLHGHIQVRRANSNTSYFTHPTYGKTCRVWPHEKRAANQKSSEAESFKHMKINIWRILHIWRWSCRPKHAVKDSENQNTIKLHTCGNITCSNQWTREMKYSETKSKTFQLQF
jgi:hypothetical protein